MPIVLPNGRTVGLYEPVHLKLAISKDTADATILFKVPSDVRLHLARIFWEVVTGFSGGTNSAIGISTDTAPNNTKGDLLGGSGGDLTATLGTAGYKGGTIGAKFGSNGVAVLAPGVGVRFDRIADAYTAGAGYVHLFGTQMIGA